MLNQEIVFSEERQTWNLFVNGEWYYEGTYEQVEEAMMNNAICDAEEEYSEDEYEEEYDDYGYEYNMPCDTYGPAACSSSCPNYAKCQGWEK